MRSAKQSFQLPSVLRLRAFVNHARANRIKFSRENVYRRDNYTCQYCGKKYPMKELTLDHVIPVCKHGQKNWANMVTACRKCNHKKGAHTPATAGMPLLTEPKAPAWLPPLDQVREQLRFSKVPDEWLLYLDGFKE